MTTASHCLANSTACSIPRSLSITGDAPMRNAPNALKLAARYGESISLDNQIRALASTHPSDWSDESCSSPWSIDTSFPESRSLPLVPLWIRFVRTILRLSGASDWTPPPCHRLIASPDLCFWSNSLATALYWVVSTTPTLPPGQTPIPHRYPE
jgi:hypothetical protein